jgi:4-alpha-glucanotransferase
MTASLIEYLVEYRGIESNYTDAWGNAATIAPETKTRLLEVMGYQVKDPDVLLSQAQDFSHKAWLTPLNPVQVLRIGQGLQIVLRLPIELVTDDYIALLTTEQGEQIKHGFCPADGQLTNVTYIEDIELQEYIIDIPHKLPLGYHHLALVVEEDELASMTLIIAPVSCFKPESLVAGNKMWGLSVQLYCLRSDNNWGVGDFSDLSYLLASVAKQGANFVGLNPIHALYPANPEACSPYGPSSRRWLNFIYIDVTAVQGYEQQAIQEMVKTVDFQQQLDTVRNTDLVDYAGVTAIKLAVLTAIFEQQNNQYLTKSTQLNKAFKAFVKEGGQSLQTLAVYDSLQEHLAAQGKPCWGWPVFPQEYSDFNNPGVSQFAKKNATRVKFFLWLQFQAALQLEQANQVAASHNMDIGLYSDLAVGVSAGSAEVWGNKALYCTQASIGAPPDILGPLGQKWGLPPMDPEQLYEQKYQPIIDLFRANMQETGALRIDHVMALLRLWWVANDDDARQGGYVYYPVDDLLGILALESHRNSSVVIGEDLGTVPAEIRLKLAGNGVYSYRVFFFEQAPDGGFFSPADYPQQSMSTLTTHDMPTLAGYWHCHDLTLGKELGLYPNEEQLQGLYDSRHSNKQRILDSLHGHHSVNDEIGYDVTQVGMSQNLNAAMQVHMAGGSSDLLCLQLEDWLQMDKPVNVPGTHKEYPNWQRKLTQSLQFIFQDLQVNNLAMSLTQARKKASR